jgi:cytoskeleton protein RodZ
MNEVAPSEVPIADGPSAGTLLRRAREGAGLHVAALAVALKVPVSKVEALENDRFELMPDMVFVRALASSICRVLHVDPKPVLSRLPQSSKPLLRRDIDGINKPFRSPSDAAPPGWRAYLKQPVFLIVSALLVGALVLMVLPSRRSNDKSPADQANGGANAESTIAVAPTETTTVPSLVSTSAQPPSGSSTLSVNSGSESAAAARGSQAPDSPAMLIPAAAVAPNPSSGASVPQAVGSTAAASGIVVVRAKGESWVEITDAKGGVAVRKVLAAGEVAGAQGALPLQVTIGRVDAIDVQVRGKPFDLTPVSRDNVARFTVK